MIFTKHTISELKNTGIYKIICYQTDRVYYGSSASKTAIHGRLMCHSKLLAKGKHHSWVLQRDYKRYRESNFEFVIVELCKPEESKLREQYYLDISNAGNSELSYNISPTAESNFGTKHSEETRKKYSLCRKGRVLSEETKLKISKGNKGKKLSPEAKKKISEKHKGRKQTPEWIENVKKAKGLGDKPLIPKKKIMEEFAINENGKRYYVRTEENKEKLRTANSKIEYLIISPEGKEYIVKGLNKFCKEHNLRPSNMSNVANGIYTNHKGWVCYHKENPKPVKQIKKQYIWKLISPEKEEFIMESLLPFCKERGLDASCFTRVASGKYKQYKGWQAFKIDKSLLVST